MIFLFLFGFTLEAVLRPHTYVLMYLASGLAASALHMSFNLGSMVPVIGASGAISGLMGMYLSLYRLRRIRFFYTVGFYLDRKSTRLNSSHVAISYAVFCLKKQNKE